MRFGGIDGSPMGLRWHRTADNGKGNDSLYQGEVLWGTRGLYTGFVGHKGTIYRFCGAQGDYIQVLWDTRGLYTGFVGHKGTIYRFCGAQGKHC